MALKVNEASILSQVDVQKNKLVQKYIELVNRITS